MADSCLCRVIDSFFFFFHLFHIGIDINESSSSLSLYRVEGIFSFLGGNFNQFSIVKKKKRMLFNSEERINQNLGYSLKKYESVLFFFFFWGRKLNSDFKVIRDSYTTDFSKILLLIIYENDFLTFL